MTVECAISVFLALNHNLLLKHTYSGHQWPVHHRLHQTGILSQGYHWTPPPSIHSCHQALHHPYSRWYTAVHSWNGRPIIYYLLSSPHSTDFTWDKQSLETWRQKIRSPSGAPFERCDTIPVPLRHPHTAYMLWDSQTLLSTKFQCQTGV